MNMRFAEPHWLFLGLVVVTMLAVLLIRSERLRSRAIATLSKGRGSDRVPRRRFAGGRVSGSRHSL